MCCECGAVAAWSVPRAINAEVSSSGGWSEECGTGGGSRTSTAPLPLPRATGVLAFGVLQSDCFGLFCSALATSGPPPHSPPHRAHCSVSLSARPALANMDGGWMDGWTDGSRTTPLHAAPPGGQLASHSSIDLSGVLPCYSIPPARLAAMHRSLSVCLLAVCAALLLPIVTADVPADLIASIPGFGKTPSKQYSGLLPADDNSAVFLHYWFVESTGNPSTDPVVVWMNGGPGCSSLEGGLYELGPFTFTGEEVDGVPTLVANPNAWNTVASVLYLEQPAGVGFSYAVNGSTTSDDWIQSQNTYGFMLNWFKAYPEYSKNDFYVTGESYAGVYVPTLAYRIYEGNKAGMPHINLKGAAIGNGCWGDAVGTCSGSPGSDRIALTLYYGHGMISQASWEKILASCGAGFNSSSDACGQAKGDAMESVGNIDVYNGLTPAPHTSFYRTLCARLPLLVSCVHTAVRLTLFAVLCVTGCQCTMCATTVLLPTRPRGCALRLASSVGVVSEWATRCSVSTPSWAATS